MSIVIKKNKPDKPKATIRFVNTFKPVVPLYEAVFPRLVEKGYYPTSFMSRGIYRSRKRHGEKDELVGYQEWVWVPYILRSNKRLCAFFFWLLAPFRLLFVPKSVNVFLTQPPLFFIVGAAISRITGAKYIIHIMDLYPEFFASLGILKSKRFIYRLISKLALNAFKHADDIFVIGRCMMHRLARKELDQAKIWFLPNWAASSILPIAEKKNSFRCQHGLEGKFTVMYSGNMGVAHEFRTILKTAKKIQNYTNIVFVFIGSGARRKEIEIAIAAGGTNLLLLDYQPANNLSYSLSAANVHFISLRPGFEGLIVPSKFYGILASWRPVLYEGRKSGEVAQAIKEIGSGMVIEPGNVEQLCSSILHYYNDRLAAETDGQRGYSAHIERFQEDIGAKAYVNTLLSIVAQ